MTHIEIRVTAIPEPCAGRNNYTIAVIGEASFERLTRAQCFDKRSELIERYSNEIGVDSVHAEAIPEEFAA